MMSYFNITFVKCLANSNFSMIPLADIIFHATIRVRVPWWEVEALFFICLFS